MQTNYVAQTLVIETFSPSHSLVECSLRIDHTGFHYIHSHNAEPRKLDKIHQCMRFNLQQVESNRYSSAVVKDLRLIYEKDKQRAESLANFEAQQKANLKLVSAELSKQSFLVPVVHEYRPYPSKKKIQPHLSYNQNNNQLVVRHFHGTGNHRGGRSLKELDNLIARYTKCINEIKKELNKLEEQHPSLIFSSIPWDCDSSKLEEVIRKREKLIKEMPKELRDEYLASLQALPSNPNDSPIQSPTAPIAVDFEAQQKANIRLISAELSKNSSLIPLVHKYFLHTSRNMIKPHLRYKQKNNQLVVRHFHGTGKNRGSRSLKELDNLIVRYTKCINEIKEELNKLKEQHPSLIFSGIPWDCDSIKLEAIIRKREKVIKEMPKELRDEYLASLKTLPSNPNDSPTQSPTTPIAEAAITGSLSQRQFLSYPVTGSPNCDTPWSLSPIELGSPLSNLARQFLPSSLDSRSLSPLSPIGLGSPFNLIREETSPHKAIVTEVSHKRSLEEDTSPLQKPITLKDTKAVENESFQTNPLKKPRLEKHSREN